MANNVFEVPTAPTPQTYAISLNGAVYYLNFSWCDPAACWVLDISDSNNTSLVQGLAMVTGVDLLEQFRYLGIASGGALVVQSGSDPAAVPTFTSLGVDGHLYFVAPAA